MRALLTKDFDNPEPSIVVGDLVVRLDTRTVEVAGTAVHLTAKEYQVLELLALRRGATLSKPMFLHHLYGGADAPDPKIIDVFVCNLRRKLAVAGLRDYIETQRGSGYALRSPRAR